MSRQIWMFTVKGNGAFPHDMLRYDACYPDTAVDADRMLAREQEREVTLISHKKPTPNRWLSFGWSLKFD